MSTSLLPEIELCWVEPDLHSDLIAELNRSAGVDCNQALSDYGRLYRQAQGFWLYQPAHTADALMGWQVLIQHGHRPRIRGAGHSMHGGSLPLAGEVLFSTLQLNSLTWYLHHPQGPRVTVGAGAQIWVVDNLARSFGYRLPVMHDGGAAAPSVGGFISAGGFGTDSQHYGGFWNHVHRIECLGPSGNHQILTPEDADFWACFGGGGQGHLVLSADLRLIPLHGGASIPPSVSPSALPSRAPLVLHSHEPHVWFSLVAPAELECKLRPILVTLHQKFTRFWEPRHPYRYPIARLDQPTPHNFHPCVDRDLIVCGIWGLPHTPRQQHVIMMLQMVEEAIAPFSDVKRYWQAELSLEQR